MRRLIHLSVLLVALLVAAAGALVAIDTARTDAPTTAPPTDGPSPVLRLPRPAPEREPRPVRIGRPTRVVVPTIGVDEQLTGLDLKSDGAMEMPDFGSAGWYDEGPRPGAAGGAVVVAPDGVEVAHRWVHPSRTAAASISV